MDNKISVPNQPASFKFPKRTFSQKTPVDRSFQGHCFKQWTWLYYKGIKDAVLCYICVNASSEKKISNGYVEYAFISKLLTNW